MDAVIERIKKLLALAANNSNEHEAALAASKAQALLEEHNLSMAAISRDPTKRDDKRRAGGLYNWQRYLWGSVANMNFCVYFSYKGTKKGSQYEHRVVGSVGNVTATEVMADYLQQSVERLAQEWAKGRGINVFCRDAIAYREGMANRLTERLAERRREKVDQAERQRSSSPNGDTRNALTILDVISDESDLNSDYLNGYEPGTTARNRARVEALQDNWRKEYEARQAKEREEYEAWAKANPVEAAKNAAKKAARNAKWAEQYYAKREREQARRNSRAPTPEEARSTLPSFGAGYNKGGDIGLDDQLDAERHAALGKG